MFNQKGGRMTTEVGLAPSSARTSPRLDHKINGELVTGGWRC